MPNQQWVYKEHSVTGSESTEGKCGTIYPVRELQSRITMTDSQEHGLPYLHNLSRQFTRTQNGVPELGATKRMNHQTIDQECRMLLADNPSLFEDKLIHTNMNGRVSIFLDY